MLVPSTHQHFLVSPRLHHDEREGHAGGFEGLDRVGIIGRKVNDIAGYDFVVFAVYREPESAFEDIDDDGPGGGVFREDLPGIHGEHDVPQNIVIDEDAGGGGFLGDWQFGVSVGVDAGLADWGSCHAVVLPMGGLASSYSTPKIANRIGPLCVALLI